MTTLSASERRARGLTAGLIGLAGGLLAAVVFLAVALATPLPWLASLATAGAVTVTNAARAKLSGVFTASHYLGTMLIVCAAVSAEGGVRAAWAIYLGGLVFFSWLDASGNTLDAE